MSIHTKFIYTELLSSKRYVNDSIKERLYRINRITGLVVTSMQPMISYYYRIMYNYDISIN